MVVPPVGAVEAVGPEVLSILIDTAKEAGKDPQRVIDMFWREIGPAVRSGVTGAALNLAMEEFLLKHVAGPFGPCCQCGATHSPDQPHQASTPEIASTALIGDPSTLVPAQESLGTECPLDEVADALLELLLHEQSDDGELPIAFGGNPRPMTVRRLEHVAPGLTLPELSVVVANLAAREFVAVDDKRTTVTVTAAGARRRDELLARGPSWRPGFNALAPERGLRGQGQSVSRSLPETPRPAG